MTGAQKCQPDNASGLCREAECPYIGQPSAASCKCYSAAANSFERILSSLNYDGADINSLTVGEIRRAL